MTGGDLSPHRAAALAWVLDSDEPAARWVVRSAVLDDPAGATADRRQMLADPGTEALLQRLGDWSAGVSASGHNSPAYTPNLLTLLADLGVGPGDDPRVDGTLDAMLECRLPDGRFAAGVVGRGATEVTWGSLLCDTHAITEVLMRYGRGADPRVERALELTLEDLADTAQGVAWPCRPDPVTGFRGPGRRGDVCPQVTLEALRAWSWLPRERRPAQVLEAARVVLGVWRERAGAKPYMFGHGYQFKVVKWPATWYSALGVLDVLGRYPELWGDEGDEGDRRSLAELMACVAAYNLDTEGRVTPQSCFRGFEAFSFGQKGRPSPFATARVHAVLHRLDALAAQAAAVDVRQLGSSKGGTGVPRPPRIPAGAG
ncbi:hypothetical protein OEB99_02230 [Actinotalea sp. M2MS4P-6]|uniref:hypothetical protein n=1 Tax=Actinotalea sp. M2MS4P-6 TaxID=2983762 RepID=UPI0021E359A3|nr:hypothetical protein [Actinotalea sp. M2MS4P-6]MCV2393116.1 hypothetical protein [Actinotalea sp. M2MS4P-6]